MAATPTLESLNPSIYVQVYFSCDRFHIWTFQWFWAASPIHSIMILLVDLYECPFSKESTMYYDCIDELFTILDPNMCSIRDGDGNAAKLPPCEGGQGSLGFIPSTTWKSMAKSKLRSEHLWTRAHIEQVPTAGIDTYSLPGPAGVEGCVAINGPKANKQPHTISESYSTRPSCDRRETRSNMHWNTFPTSQNSFSLVLASTNVFLQHQCLCNTSLPGL